MPPHREFQQQLESIAEMVRAIEAAADPSVKADMRKLVESLMRLHGEGLERALEIISQAGDPGQGIIDRLGRDPMVASLLVLYGIHPLDLEARVNQGIAKARAFLKAYGAELELIRMNENALDLRLNTNGHACGSNPAALKEAVEELIYESAPEIAMLNIAGGEPNSFVPIAALAASVTAKEVA